MCAAYTLGVPRVPCAVKKLNENYNGSLAVNSEDPILFYIQNLSQNLSKPYSANGALATDTRDILR